MNFRGHFYRRRCAAARTSQEHDESGVRDRTGARILCARQQTNAKHATRLLQTHPSERNSEKASTRVRTLMSFLCAPTHVCRCRRTGSSRGCPSSLSGTVSRPCTSCRHPSALAHATPSRSGKSKTTRAWHHCEEGLLCGDRKKARMRLNESIICSEMSAGNLWTGIKKVARPVVRLPSDSRLASATLVVPPHQRNAATRYEEDEAVLGGPVVT